MPNPGKNFINGAIAQLVARLHGMQEVTSSTLVSSTMLRSYELRMARPRDISRSLERSMLCVAFRRSGAVATLLRNAFPPHHQNPKILHPPHPNSRLHHRDWAAVD